MLKVKVPKPTEHMGSELFLARTWYVEGRAQPFSPPTPFFNLSIFIIFLSMLGG